MDIVLGLSVASSAGVGGEATIRMLLVEGENADGVVVDQDGFEVAGEGTTTVVDRAVAAILGTREGAAEGGYRLSSTGVTATDQDLTAPLRDALAAHKVDNVMLVSAFLAAAALAQPVGASVGYRHTALLFIERDAATLAMVDSADGSIAGVRRGPLPADDEAALAELTAMVADLETFETRPDGVFAVGSDGVDVAVIKPALEAATPLPVSVPEDPELSLARGAGLASANAPLFSSSTQALAWAQDPETGEVDPELLALGYSSVSAVAAYYPADYAAPAEEDEEPLAYSAVPDDADDALNLEPRRHTPFLLAASALATLFVIGVAALVIAWAVDMRPSADHRPDTGAHIVVPSPPAPARPAPPAPPPSAPPAPSPSAPPSAAPAPSSAPPSAAPAPSSAPPSAAPAPSSAPPSAAPAPRSAAPAPPPGSAQQAAPKTPQQPIRRTPAPAPAHTPPPASPPAAPPPAASPPPPAPGLPRLPAMPPMTMWLHLPFLSIPIPINAPAPPP